MRKSIGPSVLPCGTPDNTGNRLDSRPLIGTHCSQPKKYALTITTGHPLHLVPPITLSAILSGACCQKPFEICVNDVHLRSTVYFFIGIVH